MDYNSSIFVEGDSSKLNISQKMLNNSMEINDNASMSDVGMSNIISIVFSIAILLLVTPLHLGVILYERYGSDKKRTLINKLQSSICWYMILWNLSVQAITIHRFIIGPFTGMLTLTNNVLNRDTRYHYYRGCTKTLVNRV